MSERHITVDLVEAIEFGDRHPSDLLSLMLSHLVPMCPHCQAGYEEYSARKANREQGLGTGSPDLEEPAPETPTDQQGLASHWIEVLLEVPAHEEPAAIGRAAQQLPPLTLARHLLNHSHSALPGHPERSLASASLALVVLSLVATPSRVARESAARGWAYTGNAQRVLGDLTNANRAFLAARAFQREAQGGSRLFQAELDWSEGVLRRAQRRLDEAISLLEAARITYCLEEHSDKAAGCLLTLGMVHREQGQFEKASTVTHKALEAFELLEDQRMALYARQNLADYACDAKNFPAAQEMARRCKANYPREQDPLSFLRLRWTEARIARGLNCRDEAEATFLEVRDGFLSHGIGYDAALVSLALAEFYLEQNRTTEVKRLAEEIAPMFATQDVHREAMAAIKLFQDAVRRERITLVLVREIHSYMERARQDRSLRYESE